MHRFEPVVFTSFLNVWFGFFLFFFQELHLIFIYITNGNYPSSLIIVLMPPRNMSCTLILEAHTNSHSAKSSSMTS